MKRLGLIALLILCSACLRLWGEAESNKADWATPVVLENGLCKAEFKVRSQFRLSAFQLNGYENVFVENDREGSGLKTWLMYSTDAMPWRNSLSETSAEVNRLSPYELSITGPVEASSSLQLEWLVKLDDKRAILNIDQRIWNKGNTPVTLAVWTLGAIAPPAVLYTNWPDQNIPNNSKGAMIQLFTFGKLPEERFFSDGKSIGLNLITEQNTNKGFKFGVIQPDGTIYAKKNGQKLKMSSPYDSNGLYPDGGSNLTFYTTSANTPMSFGEIELIGPLRHILPGDYVSMPITLSLSPVEE